MIVADASAVLEFVLNTARGAQIADIMFQKGQTIHAPHLLDLEVLQVLRRYAGTKLTTARANQAIEDYSDMPLNRYVHEPLLERIWALRHNFSAYDAAYIALAEALRAPLITCDAALAAGHRAKVIVI